MEEQTYTNTPSPVALWVLKLGQARQYVSLPFGTIGSLAWYGGWDQQSVWSLLPLSNLKRFWSQWDDGNCYPQVDQS